jgi:hypothetical protein
MSRMSARIAVPRRPKCSIWSTVSESSVGVAGMASAVGLTGPAMSIAMTSAPFAAYSTAIARPIPRAAPVTTATFP